MNSDSLSKPKLPLDTDEIDRIPLWYAIVPVVVLVALLAINVVFYKDDATYGPNQIALIVAAMVAGLFGWAMKVPFEKMLGGINTSIGSALNAILILLMIGALAGTWLISGVVPAMVSYGLQILSPKTFLFASVVVCAIVSVITGSSWSTIATVGVAMLGIGEALGFSPGMTAGAIISGAYFGDKMSPLSDTTNLAAAMAGTELFTHIRYMLWTTVPSIVITLVIFLVIGLNQDGTGSTADAEALSQAISKKFNITPWLLIVPIGTLALVAMKVDAVVALFAGALLGGIVAVFLQPGVVHEVGNARAIFFVADAEDVVETKAESPVDADATTDPEMEDNWAVYVQKSYAAVINSMMGDVEIASDNESAAKLLKAGGMSGMMNTVWLIICAMCFGGVMEATGLLQRITRLLVSGAKSTFSLIATATGSCLFLNVTASDQYLAIVVPGRMFQKTFQDRGLAPQNLSRTLEDSGTVTSVLVPWNTCGAAQASVLSVGTLTYLPYCFFNILSPLMTLFFAAIGFKIAKLARGNPNNDDHVVALDAQDN